MEEKIYKAKTLGDAITDACADLGVTSDKLKYTTVQEGTNGFFGFGAKPFIIRVAVKEETKFSIKDIMSDKPEGKPEKKNQKNAERREVREGGRGENGREKNKKNEQKRSEQKEAVAPKKLNERENRPERTEAAAEPAREGRGVRENVRSEGGRNEGGRGKKRNGRDQKEFRTERNTAAQKESGEKNQAAASRTENKPESVKDKNRERRIDRPVEIVGDPVKTAGDFLTGLFASMQMNISYSGEYVAENNELVIDLSGEDMGVLIGKRGQTLDALQYLTSQVVNKNQPSYIRVRLDTENYRERRKETMEALALNIALKVRRTRKPVALEPMNPYERRIIHSILQSDKEVITRSEGVEPYRHVVVCPARKQRRGGFGNPEPAADVKPAEEIGSVEETVPAAETAPAEIISPAEETKAAGEIRTAKDAVTEVTETEKIAAAAVNAVETAVTEAAGIAAEKSETAAAEAVEAVTETVLKETENN